MARFVRWQHLKPNCALVLAGIVDAFRQITRNEGFLGLYRGLSPNLVGSGVSWG
jgi:hypothetical protein